MSPLLVIIFKFVLFPLLMLVGIFVMSKLKKAKSLINNKRLIIFTILFGVLGILPIVLLGLFENDFYPYVFIITYLWFITYGFLFVWFTNSSWYESIGFDNNVGLFIFSLVLSLSFGGWVHYIIFEQLNSLNYQIFASLGIWCIAIPICYRVAEDFFIRIPTPVYKLWYPEHDSNVIYWETLDLRRLKEISIRFRRSPNDEVYANVDAKIPSGVSMGQWFHRFIEDHDVKFPETPILLDHDGESYGWGFYQRKWFGLVSKPLDFEQLTEELNLKHNSIIIAKRAVLS